MELQEEKARLLIRLNTFKVDQLKTVLGRIGLSKVGKKAILFGRIEELFDQFQSYQKVKDAITHVSELNTGTPYSSSAQSRQLNYNLHGPSGVNAIGLSGPAGIGSAGPYNTYITPVHKPQIRFAQTYTLPSLPASLIPPPPVKCDPTFLFEDIKTISMYSVGLNALKSPMNIRLNLDESDYQKLEMADPISHKKLYGILMLSVQTNPSTVTPGKLAFPNGTSISCNGSYVQIVGVFAQPADLTKYIKIRAENEVKTYTFIFKLVQINSNHDILQKIMANKISKDDVLKARAAGEDEDDDIVAGDETITLRDPYTRSRIMIPSRGKKCKHWQCYDGKTFIEMTRTAKKMECPICYAPLTFQDLVVDGFFEDILAKTSIDTESIQLSHDGKWSEKPEHVVEQVIEKKVYDVCVIESSPEPEDSSRRLGTAKVSIGGGKIRDVGLILGLTASSKSRPVVIELSDDDD